jgi:hypothetical protein
VGLVEANAADLLAYLERRTDSAEDAADLLGETLVVAWRRIGDLPADDEQARLWLFGTARNVLGNHPRGLRRARDLSTRLRQEMDAELRTVGAGLHDEVADDVGDAIAQPPRRSASSSGSCTGTGSPSPRPQLCSASRPLPHEAGTPAPALTSRSGSRADEGLRRPRCRGTRQTSPPCRASRSALQSAHRLSAQPLVPNTACLVHPRWARPA